MPDRGFRLRFDRARERLKFLDAEIGAFLNARPYRPVAQFDPQTREYRISLRIEQEAPPTWSLDVGEFLYNLRSALDHLVWDLTNGKGDSKTGFPIFLKHSEFWEITKKARKPTEHSGLRKIEPLAWGARAVIDGLQPYYGRYDPPASHPLWLLHELRNADEHRTLHLVGGTLGDANYVVRDQDGSIIDSITYTSGHAAFLPLEDGAEIMSRVIEDPLITDVHVGWRFPFRDRLQRRSCPLAAGSPCPRRAGSLCRSRSSPAAPPLLA